MSARAAYRVMSAQRSRSAGHLREALQSLRVARVYDSDSPYIVWQLVQVAVALGEPGTPKLVRDAILLAPRHAGIRRLDGLVKWGRGDLKGARRALRRAAGLRSPRDQAQAAVVDLAHLLAGQRRHAAAFGALRQLPMGSEARALAEARVAELAGDLPSGLAALSRGLAEGRPSPQRRRRLAALHALADAAANAVHDPAHGTSSGEPRLEGVPREVVTMLTWTGRLDARGEEARSELARAIQSHITQEQR